MRYASAPTKSVLNTCLPSLDGGTSLGWLGSWRGAEMPIDHGNTLNYWKEWEAARSTPCLHAPLEWLKPLHMWTFLLLPPLSTASYFSESAWEVGTGLGVLFSYSFRVCTVSSSAPPLDFSQNQSHDRKIKSVHSNIYMLEWKQTIH